MSYVCVRFCCIDWLGNSSIKSENRDAFVLFNGGPRLRVALESRWITKNRSAQILYSRSFVVLFVQQNFFMSIWFIVCPSRNGGTFLLFVFLYPCRAKGSLLIFIAYWAGDWKSPLLFARINADVNYWYSMLFSLRVGAIFNRPNLCTRLIYNRLRSMFLLLFLLFLLFVSTRNRL